MSIWYWKNASHREPQGPVSAKELRQLALSNRLRHDDLVRKEGMNGWVQAHNLKGLFAVPGSHSASRPKNAAAHREGVGSQPVNTHDNRSPSGQASRPSQKVHHSTGMFQQSGSQAQNPNVGNRGGYDNATSIGIQSTLSGSTKGIDYEENPSLFSFRGRMRRTTYLLQSLGFSACIFILAVVIGFILGLMFGPDSAVTILIIALFSIGATVVLSFPFVKRLHDLDLSAWFYWLSFVPLVNIVFGLYTLFGRGTQGPNKYGPDPRM